jgi:glycosyltransferase involved in cell wall biosynthesis
MNMPTISVIVPIYNVEQYLCKCLDSILNQTFTDFELLLIDDGSPDRSGQICDEYAQQDSRIRVFHRENGGVSSARNFGLDNAQGKWIAFIDSDDWVDKTYLEHLLEGDEDVELRVMGLMKQNIRMEWEKEIPNKEIFLTDDLWRYYKLYFLYQLFGGPYTKLLLLSIINKTHIRFDPYLSNREDMIFNLQYLEQIKSISVNNYAEYYYRNTGSSLSKNILPDEFEYFVRTYEKITSPLLNNKEDIYGINGHLKNLYLGLCAVQIKHIYVHQNLKPKERRKCLTQIFAKFNRRFSGWNYLLIAKGKLPLCIISLYHGPVVIADIIFIFLFWLQRKKVS